MRNIKRESREQKDVNVVFEGVSCADEVRWAVAIHDDSAEPAEAPPTRAQRHSTADVRLDDFYAFIDEHFLAHRQSIRDVEHNELDSGESGINSSRCRTCPVARFPVHSQCLRL